MSEIEELKQELAEIKKEMEGLSPESRAYKGLKQAKADVEAKLIGAGAIAQGEGATALGKSAIMANDINADLVVTGDGNQIVVGGEARANTKALREAYLNYMHKLTSPLAITGVVKKSAGEAEMRMNLSAVYTALLTQGRGDSSDDNQKQKIPEWREMHEQRPFSVVEQLNKHRHLVVLGDPGSGKSTFVNYLALCMLGDALGYSDANLMELTRPLPEEEGKRREKDETPQPQPWDHGALLPVRVILRDFAVRGLPEGVTSADHVWTFIEKELQAAELDEYAVLLKKELREQGGLILFDGLDEVPDAEHQRVQIKQAVESFSAAFPRCRIVVTSRTYAYQNQDWKLDGFEEATLAPFTTAQIMQFADHWYAHIAHLRNQNAAETQPKAENLKRAIRASERLHGLAERPLLLTLMASLHDWRGGGDLPTRREELYDQAVDLLLHRWETQRTVVNPKTGKPEQQPSLAEWLKVDRDKVRDLLNQIAFEAHQGQAALTGTADVSEKRLINGLIDLSDSNQNYDVKYMRLVEYLSDRAGLLIPRGVKVYTFPHRTFQEYLAACHLSSNEELYPDEVARLVRADPNRWREVTLLAAAKAAKGIDSPLWDLVDALSPEVDDDAPEVRDWGARIASQAVIEIAKLDTIHKRHAPKLDRLRQRLADLMQGNRLPMFERVGAGTSLGILGDHRFDAEHWHLPTDDLLGFHLIPAGKFLMGSDPQKDGNAGEAEQPQHELDLPYDYFMARYPVTVAQFRDFLDQSGFKIENENVLKWVDNHPITNITWYEALEYCRWLDAKLKSVSSERLARAQIPAERAFWQALAENKVRVTLPSEAEWEKAARGADGRLFPWGAEFTPEFANTGETGVSSISAVGSFPAGASPYGLHEMSGNVWEWTRSLWGRDFSTPDFKYPYLLDQEREDLNAPKEALRVLRGGSFGNESVFARCAFRFRLNPDFRNGDLGFRVVVSPVLPS